MAKPSNRKRIGLMDYAFKPMWISLRTLIRTSLAGGKPNTILYPAEKMVMADDFRGELGLVMERCVGCESCARICPNKCLDMMLDETGEGMSKWMPALDMAQCMFCGLCVEVCPSTALHMTSKYETATTDRNDKIFKPHEWAIKPAEAPDQRPFPYPELYEINCTGCGSCDRACPHDVIDMLSIPGTAKKRPNGTLGPEKKLPMFNYELCVSCALCVEACPFDALEMLPRSTSAGDPVVQITDGMQSQKQEVEV